MLRSLLLTTALAIMLAALTSCSSDGESSEVVQVATSPPPTVAPTDRPSATTAPAQQQPASTPAPTTVTLAPAPTQVPTETIAPTVIAEPTPELPYWTRIGVRDAIEKYPPLNERTDYGLRNTQEWLNGGPTTIRELQEAGKIVLVDFWTYT